MLTNDVIVLILKGMGNLKSVRVRIMTEQRMNCR